MAVHAMMEGWIVIIWKLGVFCQLEILPSRFFTLILGEQSFRCVENIRNSNNKEDMIVFFFFESVMLACCFNVSTLELCFSCAFRTR